MMQGKTAIVTGASRGIGRAVALTLAEEGANIVINYAGNENAAAETARLCEKFGVQTLLVRGNVALSEDCSRLVEETVKAFGTVDI